MRAKSEPRSELTPGTPCRSLCRARQSERQGVPGVSSDLGSDFARIHELQTQVKQLGDEYDRLAAERDELEAVLGRLAVLLDQADRAAARAPTSRATR